MNFISFNGTLLFCGIVAIIILAFSLVALMAPLALFAKNGDPPKAIAYPVVGLGAIFQVYFWGFWAAVCVALALKYTQKPDVTLDWLYWVFAFMWCTALIGWLLNKEMRVTESSEESQTIQKGTLGYSLVAIIAFLFFSFLPQYSQVPYGFLLRPLGLDTYLVSKSSNPIEFDARTRSTIDGFFEGYGFFVSGNKLAQGMTTSKDPLGDLIKVEFLMNQANNQLSELDIDLLNKLYDGWGEIVSTKFVPATELMLSGMQRGGKGDINDIAKADALVAEFDEWLRNNWDNIILTLNEKFKFER
jgi:hypothetical protein